MRPEAPSGLGLKLLVYAALSYQYMRQASTKLIVSTALNDLRKY
jgi:hypothetical protein